MVEVKQIGLTVFLASCLVLFMVGCSSEEDIEPAEEAVETEIVEVAEIEPKKIELDSEDSFYSMTYSFSSDWEKYPSREAGPGFTLNDEIGALVIDHTARNVKHTDEDSLQGYFDMCAGGIADEGIDITEKTRLDIGDRPSYFIEGSIDETLYHVYYIATEDGQYRLIFAYNREDIPSFEKEFIGSLAFLESFLTNEEVVDGFKGASIEMDFEKAASLLEDYIDDFHPSSDDPVHRLLEITNELSVLVGRCSLIIDSVDNKKTLYYGGVEELSDGCNILPSLQGSTSSYLPGSMYIKVGFYAQDWLFFESVKLTFTDVETRAWTGSWKSYNLTRDVLGGGSIFEASPSVSLNSSDVETFASSTADVLRFRGADEKNRDHQVTEAEQEALKTLAQIYTLSQEAKDILEGRAGSASAK